MATLTAHPDQLQGLLKNHMTSGTICCAGMFQQHLIFKQRERMLDSSMLLFDSDGDGRARVGHATTISHCDVTATNGVIHIIDEVLPDAVRKYTRTQEVGRGGGGGRNQEEGADTTGRFRNFFSGNWHMERPNFGPFYDSVNMQWDTFLRQIQQMQQHMRSNVGEFSLQFGKK